MQAKKRGSKQNERWSALMRKSQEGDAEAYRRLLTEISMTLRGFLAKKIHDTELMEDTLQEILLGIHKAKHTYRPTESFSSWMFAIARYKVIDFYRRNKRLSGEINVAEEIDHIYYQLELGSEIDDVRVVQQALRSLPEKQGKVVQLLKLDGLSIKEVSKKTGMSESAVKVTAHRAYKALRKILEEGRV